jgi:hypothetical protein
VQLGEVAVVAKPADDETRLYLSAATEEAGRPIVDLAEAQKILCGADLATWTRVSREMGRE